MLALLAIALAGKDIGYNLLYQSWMKPTEGCAAASLPSWLTGKYIIGGPAGLDYGGEQFPAYLDGLGMFAKITLQSDKVCFQSKALGSTFYNQSVQEGHVAPGMLFEETVPPRPKCKIPMCDTFGGNDNNYVNSVMLGNDQDTVQVLSDTTLMLDLDLDTLAVKGKKHAWHDKLSEFGHISKMGSAHPLPSGDGWVGLATSMPLMPMEKNIFHIWKIDPSSPDVRTALWTIDLDHTPYMHSFGLTETHAVVPMNADFEEPKNPMARPYMAHQMNVSWKGVYLVDLASGEHTLFDCPSFNHVHVANTFENGTGVSCDIGMSRTFAAFKPGPLTSTADAQNKTIRDSIDRSALFRLERLHFHLAGPLKGQCTAEPISTPNRETDFFRINMRNNGKPYCVVYAVEWFHDDHSFASMAVLKQNICTGEKTYWSRENWYPSEAIFEANPAGTAEDDGVVMFLAHDGEKAESSLVVLDASTMQEVSVSLLPQRIGFTAHAQFYPAKAVSVVV